MAADGGDGQLPDGGAAEQDLAGLPIAEAQGEAEEGGFPLAGTRDGAGDFPLGDEEGCAL